MTKTPTNNHRNAQKRYEAKKRLEGWRYYLIFAAPEIIEQVRRYYKQLKKEK